MRPPPPGDAPLLAIQRGLESLYRIDTRLNIHDFLLTEAQRAWLSPDRLPREQLLLLEHAGELELALYLEEGLLSTLSRHDPRQGINEDNLSALLLVLEGVSHFIYTVDRASHKRCVSALELELQAEVDKYVSLVLLTWDHRADRRHGDLITRLFRRVSYAPDLSAEEHSRYTTANAAAAAYAGTLERRYLRQRALSAFLQDVRRFWRLSCTDKLSHINQGA